MVRDRVVATLTLLSFALVYVFPIETVHAVIQRDPGEPRPAVSAAEGLARNLERIERFLERQLPITSAAGVAAASTEAQAVPVGVEAVRSIREKLQGQGAEVLRQIAADGERIHDLGLPERVAARHRATTLQIRRGLASLEAALRKVESAEPTERQQLLGSALATLRELQGPAFHNPLDPAKLPYRPRGPEARAPRTETSQFLTPAEGSPSKATTPMPADLAETIDARFSDGIRELAASLGGHPVNIYNWVRRNIRFIPTFGSIQGSELCRLSRECNAHDAASLLIALLRVSGIPARYVAGTLEVNPDLFRSALGDFVDLESATRLAASGGVPTVLVNDGAGQPVAVRLEHVWVEAFVDYIPSRSGGSGAGDTWVPLEALLKPLRFQAPVALEAVTSTDVDQLVDDIEASGTTDPDGSITFISQQVVQGAVEDLRADFKRHTLEDLPDDVTVGEVLGAVEIEAAELSLLPASLPGKLLAGGVRTSELASSDRHQVNLKILDRFGFEDVSFSSSTAELAGKRVTVSYLPASADDVATIESFGGYYNVPPYLLDLRPAILLEGEPVALGAAVPMGTIQTLRATFREPGGGTDFVEHQIAAGTYAAFGLDLQRITREAIEERRDRFEQATAAVDVDTELDDIQGELLHLQAMEYFAQVELSSRISAHQANVVALKRPAEMLATLAPSFAFLFGSATDITDLGMNVDVRRFIVSVASRVGDREVEKSFVLVTGMYGSATEHAIFEELQSADSVSALKLISEANDRGIPIFAVDESNLSQILPLLAVSSAVVNDVRNSVNAGKQVVIPQQQLSFFDWTGVGYIVVDPDTGAAAYLISGGLAGGGTAGGFDWEDVTSTLVAITTYIANVAGAILPVLQGAAKLSQAYIDKLPLISKIITGISAIATAITVGVNTESLWNGLGAGLIDLAGSLFVGWAMGAIAGLSFFVGGGILATILLAVIAVVLTFIVLQIVSFLIGLFFPAPPVAAIAGYLWRSRHRHLAEGGGPPDPEPEPLWRTAWGVA